ncbi:DNA-binding protein [uncultured Thiodictyon sp.]|jgi:chromosome segregation ATPase|uniref:DNA-binding protein n=1 Tax=uncultured Thiodictyon sp. TaxID=1846217 RepID=UPI0025D20E56|nr:DNA-binding protein [uncultured Thiodictyon sp.]
MASTTTTRESAKTAALAILRRGERPTAEKVRAAVGHGAQQTILSALDEFWADLGERLGEPRLPAAVVDAAAALWSLALQEGAQQWDTERAAAATRMADLAAVVDRQREEQTAVLAQCDQHQGENRQLTARLDEASAALAATRQEAADLRDQVQGLDLVVAALRTELAAERTGRAGDQATWLQQVDETRQRLKATEGALVKTQGALDHVRDTEAAQRADLARTSQRGADLERHLQEQVAAVAALRARGEDQAAQQRGLQTALATATRECDQAVGAAAQADAECATLRARCAHLEQERQTHLAQLAAGREASAEAARALRRDLQELLRPVLEQRHPTTAPVPGAAPTP